MNINRVIIGGNLTRDPEIRVTPQGTSVAQFALANNRKFRDAGGNDREEVAFIDCEAWGKTGENIAKFFAKGRPICVEGRLKQDAWEDKQTGQKRTRIKVVVDSFHFVGGKREDSPSAGSAVSATNTAGEEVPW